jgi:hypothetical protein
MNAKKHAGTVYPPGPDLRVPRPNYSMLSRKCACCGHPDHWHRHDDEACLSKHPQPCAPDGSGPRPIHPAPFRCLGYDCELPGPVLGTPETRCGCAHFVAPEVSS